MNVSSIFYFSKLTSINAQCCGLAVTEPAEKSDMGLF